MKDIRFNTISGFIGDVGKTSTSLEFIEWWGKEGMQFDFYNPADDDVKSISLTKDELHALVVACIVSNFVDIDSAKKEADDMKIESTERQKQVEHNNKLALIPNALTGLGELGRLDY